MNFTARLPRRAVTLFAAMWCVATVVGCTASPAPDSPAPAPQEEAVPAEVADETQAEVPGDPEATREVPEELPGVGEETAEGWLERLEAGTADTRSLKARVRMVNRVGIFEEETTRFAELIYAGADEEQPSRFAVRFDRLKMDDVIEPIEQAYVFDGHWLLDLDGQDKVATRRELVAPGDTADLDIGEGPFPIPLNLKKDRVFQRFDVELIPPADGDPKPKQTSDAGSVHLRLVPHEGVEIEAEVIDLWFDRQTLLPARAVTLQEDGDSTTVDLFSPQADAPVRKGTFDTTLPAGNDWETQIVPID